MIRKNQKKSIEAIDNEIRKTKAELTGIEERYNRKAEKLKELQAKKRQCEADSIMAAFKKSNKSYEEIMTFLQF